MLEVDGSRHLRVSDEGRMTEFLIFVCGVIFGAVIGYSTIVSRLMKELQERCDACTSLFEESQEPFKRGDKVKFYYLGEEFKKASDAFHVVSNLIYKIL